MADDFTGRFQYGLNNLPMEPPDDPSALLSPAGFASMGQGAGAQIVPASYGLPRARLLRPGSFPAPGSPSPQIPRPSLPDWWNVLEAGLQLYPMAASRLAGRRRNAAGSRSRARDDDDDWCYQRYLAELKKCEDKKDDYAHPHFLSGCKDRAKDRWDKCNRNGGRPHPEEPLEWGPEDEDIYFETGR